MPCCGLLYFILLFSGPRAALVLGFGPRAALVFGFGPRAALAFGVGPRAALDFGLLAQGRPLARTCGSARAKKPRVQIKPHCVKFSAYVMQGQVWMMH